ncbi:MAG: phosphoribosylanthranilate isomerase [Alphaproteobacteria bacterium]|nr:phosphoribosylanthranilate isomerase [Alphaproteobacteria bacterium]
MSTRAKICGLKTPETVAAAVEGGASYIGFNFYPRSPRAVTPEAAARLAALVPASVAKVALVVDADDALIDTIAGALAPEILQLHGSETPERVAAIRVRTGRKVMKALAIATPADVERMRAYEFVADLLMFDAKPPPGGLPGGNGLPFDWRLLKDERWSRPWLLAGGLTPENVAEAIRSTGATQVDVSSGVEDRPGVKSPEKIRQFLAAATGRS